MSLMNHHHCQHKRMLRKEVKSRLISVLVIDVVWPLKRPKSTHSFGLKFVWQHWHPFYCWFGIQYQTIWCPSNTFCKLEATLWFFSLFSFVIVVFQEWTSCMGIHLSCNPNVSCHFEILQWHPKSWCERDL